VGDELPLVKARRVKAPSFSEEEPALLRHPPGVTRTDRFCEPRPMSLNDVLVVAPYNAQVSEIGRRVPGGRVGTVDKFQGQEAPVVIYSITTSSQDEAPHGMEFLFSRHRLNVATSRARCVCILVGTPQIFEPNCRTPKQMRMANAFCTYLERAVVRWPFAVTEASPPTSIPAMVLHQHNTQHLLLGSKAPPEFSLRRGGHSPLLTALGELHGRNLASAFMRSRVHNRTSDRGGKPIRLAWPWARPRSLRKDRGRSYCTDVANQYRQAASYVDS
jgi:AAA domain